MKAPTQREEDKLKKKACEISIKEGSAYSVMEGFGLRYIAPYALALGANNMNIGVLSSLPTLVGSFSEIYAVRLMKKFSRKAIVFWSVLLQAIMWLAIIGIGALFFIYGIDHTLAPNLLVIAYTLCIVFGTFPGPAWASWMKDIVPLQFGRYFGIRNRVTGIVVLASMLIAGYILDAYKNTHLFLGFAILFIVAFIGRATSAYLFTKKYEPCYVHNNHYHDGFIHFMKKLTKNNFGRFSLYVAIFYLVVAIASPFFAVYMLNELHFSYLSFTLVLISSMVIRLMVMPAWGRFSDKYGNMKVVTISSFLVPLVPLLWLASLLVPDSFIVAYLILVEAFSGFVWAGNDLSIGNFVYDAVPRERFAMAVADFTILANIGTFIGALLGGYLSTQTFELFGLSSILCVFLLSGILRFAVTAIMIPGIKEVRQVKKFGIHEAEKAMIHMSHGKLGRILVR